jgi:hypothetical protein
VASRWRLPPLRLPVSRSPFHRKPIHLPSEYRRHHKTNGGTCSGALSEKELYPSKTYPHATREKKIKKIYSTLCTTKVCISKNSGPFHLVVLLYNYIKRLWRAPILLVVLHRLSTAAQLINPLQS